MYSLWRSNLSEDMLVANSKSLGPHHLIGLSENRAYSAMSAMTIYKTFSINGK